jgi:hypothetical protein
MSNLNSWIAEGEAALTAGVNVYDAATGKTQQVTAVGGTASGTSPNTAGSASTAAAGIPSFLTSKTTEYIVIAVGAVAALAVVYLVLKK